MVSLYIIITLAIYIWYITGLMNKGYIPKSKTALFMFCLLWFPALCWFIFEFFFNLVKPKSELDRFFQDYRFNFDIRDKTKKVEILSKFKWLLGYGAIEEENVVHYWTHLEGFMFNELSNPDIVGKVVNDEMLRHLIKNTQYVGNDRLKAMQLQVLQEIDWDDLV